MLTVTDRIQGGLWGLLIGDAVGVPYEFHQPEQLPEYALLDIIPPENFNRAHATVPVGTWSDDGAQALTLLASLLNKYSMDIDDFAQRLVNWYQVGYMAVDFKVFDVGIQTAQAIRRLMAGTPAIQAGATDEHANGNGSLMRVLPLALWHQGSDEELVKDAYLQSQVTHAHLRSKVCCALYCLWARYLLKEQNIEQAWQTAVAILRRLYGQDSADYAELEWNIRPDETPYGTGSGYVVDCLRSARIALQQNNFEAVIKTAIAFGHDTDTTACVAGGLAGIYYGKQGIPARWLEILRGKELVEPLLAQLISHSKT